MVFPAKNRSGEWLDSFKSGVNEFDPAYFEIHRLQQLKMVFPCDIILPLTKESIGGNEDWNRKFVQTQL